MHPRARSHEQRIAGGKIQNSREVGQVASPISPRRHKSGEVAESAFAPDIQAALVGIARGEFYYRERERRIENEPGADPNDDRTRARSSGGSDPAQADAGDHVEQEQIAKAEYATGAAGISGKRIVRPGRAVLGGAAEGGWACAAV